MKLWFNLLCRDVEAQMVYYQALLGLKESVPSRSPIYRALQTPDFQLGFNAWAAYALLHIDDRMPDAEESAPVTAYATFMVATPEEVDVAAKRAVALGGRAIKPPYATYYGQWMTVLADPENYIFRISTEKLPEGVKAPVLNI